MDPRSRCRSVLLGAAACLLLLPAAASAGWKPDVQDARDYARSRAGDVSFSVVGLNGRQRGYDAGADAPLASVFK